MPINATTRQNSSYDIVESSLAALKESNPDFYDYWEKKQSEGDDHLMHDVDITVRAAYSIVDNEGVDVKENVVTGLKNGVYFASTNIKISTERKRSANDWSKIYKAKSSDIIHATGHLWLRMKHLPYESPTFNSPGEKNARMFEDGLNKKGATWRDVQSQKYIK